MSAPGMAARIAAANLLSGVIEQKRSMSDLVAAKNGPMVDLDPSDRARAQSLATGALRHLGRIDAIIDGFVKRRPANGAMNALRLATAEMNVDGIPPHAAVDTAVRLARADAKSHRQSGLVNAVARKIARGGQDLWRETPHGEVPDWLSGPMLRAYGSETCAAILSAQADQTPPVDLTLRSNGDAAAWADRLGGEVLPTGSIRLKKPGRISALPGYDTGDWWVQDAAAALPVLLSGDLSGKSVLDVCAAPGGKTLQLAASGAIVTAVDISDLRLQRLQENLSRTRLAATVVTADVLTWEPASRFDVILVDAPCSATGTLRRHPDLPFVRQKGDMKPLREIQAKMLERAWGWLVPGGRLIYCTCSLFPSEGEKQIERFLSSEPTARQLRPEPEGVPAEWFNSSGGMRTRPDFWPERGGLDGFFASVLEKSVADG